MKRSTDRWVIVVQGLLPDSFAFLTEVKQQDGMTHLEKPKIAASRKIDNALILDSNDVKPWLSYINRTLEPISHLRFQVMPYDEAQIEAMVRVIGAE